MFFEASSMCLSRPRMSILRGRLVESEARFN
jgi:hypothetical protein